MKKATLVQLTLLLGILIVVAMPFTLALTDKDFLEVQKFKTTHSYFDAAANKTEYTYTFSEDKECLGRPLPDPFFPYMLDSKKYCCVKITARNPLAVSMALSDKLTKGHGIDECKEVCHTEYINSTNLTK